MIRGILFDVDGTLVLSNDAHAQAWVEAFAAYGFMVQFDDIRKLIGMGSDKLIDSLFPEMNDEEGIGNQIKERRKELFLEKYAAGLRPAPGARDLVKAVHDTGLKMIAATSAGTKELSILLKAAQVDDLLTEATTSDDADNSKPDPDIVEVALEKICLPADEAVMIGDTPYDIEAASKAGVRCIAVRCGGWDDESLRGAVAIYDDPAAVLKQHGYLL
jgi:HAD superfamily hydrolase (TIGR01549 family)